MEHRRGHRLPTSLPVSIRNHQSSLGDFVVKDISTGGMRILGSDRRLSKGDFVHLEFDSNDSQQNTHPSCMKAIVVYRNKQSAGLMWAEENTRFKSLLQTVAGRAA